MIKKKKNAEKAFHSFLFSQFYRSHSPRRDQASLVVLGLLTPFTLVSIRSATVLTGSYSREAPSFPPSGRHTVYYVIPIVYSLATSTPAPCPFVPAWSFASWPRVPLLPPPQVPTADPSPRLLPPITPLLPSRMQLSLPTVLEVSTSLRKVSRDPFSSGA